MTLAALDYRPAIDFWETPKGRPCKFWYREGTNDWSTIHSCLGTNDEYHLKDLTLDGEAIDIGGYLGSVGVALAMDNPDLHVSIIEPVPENADLIERNAQENEVSDRVDVHRVAIGPKGITESEIRFRYVGDKNLEHHAFVGNSSLAYPDGGSVQHEALQVPTYGLEALLNLLGVKEPSFVKIDCEGGEWPFLETATQTALRRLPLIVGEAHPVTGHSSTDMERVLGKTHDVTMDAWLFSAVRR